MKKSVLTLVAVFFLVGRAYGQTATPTNTPTNTPTATVTPTPTVTPTATPILTNPFRFDNLQTKVETWLGITESQSPLAPANDGRMIYDTGTQTWLCSANGGAFQRCFFSIQHYNFATLPSPTPGTISYCDDCNPTSPCAAGTPAAGGVFAFAEGTNWNCCLGCPCPTATPTPTSTSTPTNTPTSTPTNTPTNTPTATPTP